MPTADSTPGILDHDAERVCRLLAPRDLAGRPLYVIRESQLPEAQRGSACWGYTSSIVDLVTREAIGAEWKGRGPAMVIDDVQAGRCHPHDARDYFISTAVHELAHMIESEWSFDADEIAPAEVAEVALLFAAEAQIDRQPRPFDHSPTFFRIAAHLYWRAKQMGVFLFPKDLFGGYLQPRWSGSRAYIAALAGEPERMAFRPFTEIKNKPIPDDFVLLWGRDAGV